MGKVKVCRIYFVIRVGKSGGWGILMGDYSRGAGYWPYLMR